MGVASGAARAWAKARVKGMTMGTPMNKGKNETGLKCDNKDKGEDNKREYKDTCMGMGIDKAMDIRMPSWKAEKRQNGYTRVHTTSNTLAKPCVSQ